MARQRFRYTCQTAHRQYDCKVTRYVPPVHLYRPGTHVNQACGHWPEITRSGFPGWSLSRSDKPPEGITGIKFDRSQQATGFFSSFRLYRHGETGSDRRDRPGIGSFFGCQIYRLAVPHMMLNQNSSWWLLDVAPGIIGPDEHL